MDTSRSRGGGKAPTGTASVGASISGLALSLNRTLNASASASAHATQPLKRQGTSYGFQDHASVRFVSYDVAAVYLRHCVYR